MVNSEEFVMRLQKMMDYYTLSASAFAEKIDFNKSSISHLLSGRNKPSLDFVLKVLEAFPEVSLYWLLNGKGSFPKQDEDDVIDMFPSTPIIANKNESKQTISANTHNSSEIERIIVLYKDGSFKSYEN